MEEDIVFIMLFSPRNIFGLYFFLILRKERIYMSANNESKRKLKTKDLAACAMLSAVAFVLQFLEFAIPIIPSFIKLDVSDIPALLGTFALGPVYRVVIELVKNIIHLPFGTSMAVGELCNFLLGAVFTFTAGMVYKYKHTRTGAIVGCLVGAFAMSAVCIPLNYFFVYPAYVVIYNMPLDAIIEMYKTILPTVASTPTDNTLLNCLIIFNLPFTFLKGLLEAVICYAIYKPLSRLYRR